MSFRRKNIGIPASSGSINSTRSAASSTGPRESPAQSSIAAGAPARDGNRNAILDPGTDSGTGVTSNDANASNTSTSTPSPSASASRSQPESSSSSPSTKPTPAQTPSFPGMRPSHVDGRPTTSTGTPSLDAMLASHGGLALGTSLLVEESATTDYAGILLRYYAAEGIVQGHVLHVLAAGEQWTRGLPGLVGAGDAGRGGKGLLASDGTGVGGERREKMKIAWRYERLGEFGSGIGGREGPLNPKPDTSSQDSSKAPFCHSYDLSKTLAFPIGTSINYIPLAQSPNPHYQSPFTPAIVSLSKSLNSTPPERPHRLVIPSLFSPSIYPDIASHPSQRLQFFHSLRALLRKYSTRLTAMISLPLDLYPRSSALVRWMELLSDGVLELTPFVFQSENNANAKSDMRTSSSSSTSSAAGGKEETPQGLLRIHRLPVLQERGGGGAGGGRYSLGEDLAFVASRRTFTIKPFYLPPVDGGDAGEGKMMKDKKGEDEMKADLEF